MRKIAGMTAAAGLLLLGSGAFLGLVQLTLGHEPMPPLAGNSPPGGLHIPDSPAPRYRIGVLGDAQKGIANLENVVRAVQAEQVDFMIQTGDLVSTSDEGHYRLVSRALRRADLSVRFLVAPGNHDVKGGVERFRRELGDDEFRFRRNGLVFLILNNATGVPPDIRHVEEALKGIDPESPIILAMHVPPFDVQGNAQKDYAPFLDWLEKSRVRYLLTGHAHGYFKKQVGGCTVVVNGVGGDSDSWQMDQKVYATILDVDGSTITDHAVVLPPEHGVWENVVHLAVGHFSEGFRRNPVRCWGGTLLLGVVVGVSWGVLRLRP